MITPSLFRRLGAMVALAATAPALYAAHPVVSLLERIEAGSSARFVITETGPLPDAPYGYFEISSADGKPKISGDSPVSIAAGLNWYLKYYAGVHIAWNAPAPSLPEVLPLPEMSERHCATVGRRYYLNYCTFSYSMAFWDWQRWEREIDWMALHGINMPLAAVGADVVWRNTLLRLGYSPQEADSFIAGPAYQAWWLMNNLEGWGGPNSPEWYASREELQKCILGRMRSYGMEPVLPGYSGMVPHGGADRLGVPASAGGFWNGFVRPATLLPDDPAFGRLADIYYEELTHLCGTSRYYSMDPFHEGGNDSGIDLRGCGAAIAGAMKRANPDAVWVVQGWNENPRPGLLEGVRPGDMVVLDLSSESVPNWGDTDYPEVTTRSGGYGPHQWIYCMLLNFGGNVGLHGRMDSVIDGFYKALSSPWGDRLTGIGITPEGIGNNPVMYELFSELAWRPEKFSRDSWVSSYATARYGASDSCVDKAWKRLASTVYNCPMGIRQQGTTESIFCARPSAGAWQVSSWSMMEPYYEGADVIAAAFDFASAVPSLRTNPNYRYDLVDIVRQAVAEKGRESYLAMTDALGEGDSSRFAGAAGRFLNLLKAQDRLLSSVPEFNVGEWIESAGVFARDEAERNLLEENARRLITTWGPREASEGGRLHDYAHREWGGLLRDFYLPRWEAWIDARSRRLSGPEPEIDYFSLDDRWVRSREDYPLSGEDCVDVALATLRLLREE